LQRDADGELRRTTSASALDGIAPAAVDPGEARSALGQLSPREYLRRSKSEDLGAANFQL
jgi:hypothetical protein